MAQVAHCGGAQGQSWVSPMGPREVHRGRGDGVRGSHEGLVGGAR